MPSVLKPRLCTGPLCRKQQQQQQQQNYRPAVSDLIPRKFRSRPGQSVNCRVCGWEHELLLPWLCEFWWSWRYGVFLVATINRFSTKDCIILEIKVLTILVATCVDFSGRKSTVAWPLEPKKTGKRSFATLKTYWKICWPLGIFIHPNLIGSLALCRTEG